MVGREERGKSLYHVTPDVKVMTVRRYDLGRREKRRTIAKCGMEKKKEE